MRRRVLATAAALLAFSCAGGAARTAPAPAAAPPPVPGPAARAAALDYALSAVEEAQRAADAADRSRDR